MPAKTRGWWKRLPDDCPISLESIESLDYPPFDLVMDESHTTYFDGFQLAEYLVSYGSFRHPITRRDITRDECEQLDAYLREHRPGFLAGVLHAFDHQEEYNLDRLPTLGQALLRSIADSDQEARAYDSSEELEAFMNQDVHVEQPAEQRSIASWRRLPH